MDSILYELANSQVTWQPKVEFAIRAGVESLQRFADENPEIAGLAGVVVTACFILGRIVARKD